MDPSNTGTHHLRPPNEHEYTDNTHLDSNDSSTTTGTTIAHNPTRNNSVDSNTGSNKRYKQMMQYDDEMTTADKPPSSSSLPTATATTIHDNHCRYKNDRSIIIFSSSQCHFIVTQHRMAPVYIGIPLIRPEIDIPTTANTQAINVTTNDTSTIVKHTQSRTNNNVQPKPKQPPPPPPQIGRAHV